LIIPLVLLSLSRAVNRELPVIAGKIASATAFAGESDREETFRPPGISCFLASGLIMFVAGSLSTEIFGVPWTGGVRRLFYCWSFCFFFGYGVAAWFYVVLILMAHRVSKLRVEADVFSWPRAPPLLSHKVQ
jgi:hypothetical protein